MYLPTINIVFIISNENKLVGTVTVRLIGKRHLLVFIYLNIYFKFKCIVSFIEIIFFVLFKMSFLYFFLRIYFSVTVLIFINKLFLK